MTPTPIASLARIKKSGAMTRNDSARAPRVGLLTGDCRLSA